MGRRESKGCEVKGTGRERMHPAAGDALTVPPMFAQLLSIGDALQEHPHGKASSLPPQACWQ